MSDQQHQPAGPQVVNYDDIWDYEPRQTTIGETQLWGRGIPRAPLVYGIVLVPVLLILAHLPIWPVYWIPSGLLRLLASVAIAVVASWWAWQVPPGGVRPHKAASAIARGVTSPRNLRGWVSVPGDVEQMRPAPLPIEPDFAGVWPRAQYIGPGLLVRVGGANEVTVAQRRGPKRIFHQATGVRPTPQVLQISAGTSVELAPALAPRRTTR